jgi:hypothetical protein
MSESAGVRIIRFGVATRLSVVRQLPGALAPWTRGPEDRERFSPMAPWRISIGPVVPRDITVLAPWPPGAFCSRRRHRGARYLVSRSGLTWKLFVRWKKARRRRAEFPPDAKFPRSLPPMRGRRRIGGRMASVRTGLPLNHGHRTARGARTRGASSGTLRRIERLVLKGIGRPEMLRAPYSWRIEHSWRIE